MTVQRRAPVCRFRARMLVLPTTSTLPPKTPAMNRSPSICGLFQTGVPSRRLMQWTELESGAVKTTLPSATAGGEVFQLASVAGPMPRLGFLFGGDGWEGAPNWVLHGAAGTTPPEGDSTHSRQLLRAEPRNAAAVRRPH